MKWWVSREQHESQVRFLRETLTIERVRYAELLEKYNALRMTGANPLPPAAEVPALPEKKEDEAKTLIHEIAGKNLKLRSLMLKQLKQDRADGKAEEQILASIQAGVTSDGVPG